MTESRKNRDRLPKQTHKSASAHKAAVQELYLFVALDGHSFVPCGLLTIWGEGRSLQSTFEYGRRYLERSDAVAIDPDRLPLPPPGIVRAYATEPGTGLPGAIRDTAPDQWGRFLMNRVSGRDLSEFDCLLALADLRIGDLAYGLTPVLPERRVPWTTSDSLLDGTLELAQLQEAVEAIDRDDESIRFVELFVDRGSSLGGSRTKANVTWKGEPWIAKFTSKRDPYNVARVEFATMALAHKCGLVVPEIDLTSVMGNCDIFLIKRFDRKRDLLGLARTGFLSGLTATGLVNLSDSVLGGVGYRNLVSWLRRHGSSYKEDIRELFKRMVFNIICNNNDDHLKNHGFLRDGHQWRLSPLYDVLPSRDIGIEGRRLLLAVGVRGREATLENALSEAQLFGLSLHEAEIEISNLVQIALNWRVTFQECGVSKADIEYFSSSFLALDAWNQRKKDELVNKSVGQSI